MTRHTNEDDRCEADADEKSRSGSPETVKVVLGIEPAEEIVALLGDETGRADEDLLDRAREALDDAGHRVPSEAQELAAGGDAVALELTPEAVEAVETLILRNTEVRPKLLRRTRERLQGKLQRARQKRRDRR